jgi:hypothetical protein
MGASILVAKLRVLVAGAIANRQSPGVLEHPLI